FRSSIICSSCLGFRSVCCCMMYLVFSGEMEGLLALFAKGICPDIKISCFLESQQIYKGYVQILVLQLAYVLRKFTRALSGTIKWDSCLTQNPNCERGNTYFESDKGNNTIASLTDLLGEGDDTKIKILMKLDKEQKILSIRDRGIRMTKEDLIKDFKTNTKTGTSAERSLIEGEEVEEDGNLPGCFLRAKAIGLMPMIDQCSWRVSVNTVLIQGQLFAFYLKECYVKRYLHIHVGWPLYRRCGHAFEAFKLIVADPDTNQSLH
ncbi:hypothetical protein C5167_021841, partial [Papaver somniferum]